MQFSLLQLLSASSYISLLNEMNSSLKRQLLRTFSQMVDDLKDSKEIETFLKDFFDEEELEKYVKRMAITYWLKKGRDRENIKRNLQATPKEITEAEKSLKKEGIKLALKKIEAEEWANVWAERIKKITYGRGKS
jgi:uncharacterized protein YerC